MKHRILLKGELPLVLACQSSTALVRALHGLWRRRLPRLLLWLEEATCTSFWGCDCGAVVRRAVSDDVLCSQCSPARRLLCSRCWRAQRSASALGLRTVSPHGAPSQLANRPVLVVKSSKDNRYSESEVVSHLGLRRARSQPDCPPPCALTLLLPAQPCHAVRELLPLLTLDEYKRAEVLAIDEVSKSHPACTSLHVYSPSSQAHFFADLLSFCHTAVNVHSKRVYVAGLDLDFRRAKFGQVLDLSTLANVTDAKSGKCNFCESRSLFSLRRVPGAPRQSLHALLTRLHRRAHGAGGRQRPVCADLRGLLLEAQHAVGTTMNGVAF